MKALLARASILVITLAFGCEDSAHYPRSLPLSDAGVTSRAEVSLHSARNSGALLLVSIGLDLGETVLLSDRDREDAVVVTVDSVIPLSSEGTTLSAPTIAPATYSVAQISPREGNTIALELEIGILGLTQTVRVDGLPPVEVRCAETSVYVGDDDTLLVDLELKLENLILLLVSILPPIPLSIITIDSEARPTLHGQLSALFKDAWTARCATSR